MRHLTLVPSWLRFLTIILLVMGILFRFCNLDAKVYSRDETYTSLRISGYTVDEVKQQIFNGSVINKESFTKFQSPNLQKGVSDTIMSLVKEDSQDSPLYYVIARFWVEVFGNSITAIRSLSALTSLLVFPCIYWLCRELFDLPLSLPRVAIALMAVSPIQLIYAQEAREYILWLVTIIISSASLLRAIRIETKDRNELEKTQQIPDRFTTWGIYTITLVLSLYTCLWSGFVAVAHGIYVMITARFQLTETVRSYFLASVMGFVGFMPWMTIAIADFFQFLISADATTAQLSQMPLIPFWLMQIGRIFLDLDLSLKNSVGYLISPIFLALVGYAIYFLWRTTNYKVWLFLVVLIIVPALPLILPDLISGGIRLDSEPYLMPSYLGIQLAVAYLLAMQLYNENLSRRGMWYIILALVIICSLVSSRVNYQAETWWNKGVSYGNPQVAKIINRSERPILISNSVGINYGNVFSLSYLVQPKVQFQLVQNQSIPNIPNGFTDVFILNPPKKWREQIATKYQSQTNIVYQDSYYSLWKLAQPRISPQRVSPRRNRLSSS
ncbi:glycosyltransferase family 39 protein [Nostocaceae cyanobacterium CENA369]|uniref:Glycosyltransferase family 39 protein n=1 Tax=Dendronalium phyllosphericum CENA369 TaxID=1725256 RepID=A0A8J7I0N5_9NOST|nr:glycosyltransferase family 39 protein [Dendronalium phyllosphericum]MBH8573661.1 glycosyltransferase family 39 protein [Dendronalium phyllosphericum CENA369]